MSAEKVVDVQESNSEIIVEARAMGWVPKEEFKGAEEKWVDAEKFVEHGRTVLPILAKNNKDLIKNLNSLHTQMATMKAELEASKSDLTNIQEFYQEQLVERVKQTRKELLEQIKEAKRDQDVDLEVDLTDKLTQLTESARELKDKKKEIEQTASPVIPPDQVLAPELQAWMAENGDWFGKDTARTNEAIGYGHIVRARNPGLIGKAFYDKVDEMIADNAPDDHTPKARPASKVAGSRGGATRGNGSQSRTFDDLPAEAKAECNRQAKKLVNPNGLYKTAGDFQKFYIKTLEDTGFFQDQQR